MSCWIKLVFVYSTGQRRVFFMVRILLWSFIFEASRGQPALAVVNQIRVSNLWPARVTNSIPGPRETSRLANIICLFTKDVSKCAFNRDKCILLTTLFLFFIILKNSYITISKTVALQFDWRYTTLIWIWFKKKSKY